MDYSNYKYSYRIGLTPINQELEVDFSKDRISESKSVSAYINDCITRFTDSSKHSTLNSKCVDPDSVVVTERDIVFTLYAEKELTVPGKCVRLLSQYILEEKYFDKLLVNRKLFKTYTPSEVTDEATGEIKLVDAASQISDADLVKALIDYLLTSQYPYTPEKNNMRNAVEQMKVIAAQAGIVKLD